MDFYDSLSDYLPIAEIEGIRNSQTEEVTHAVLLNPSKISDEEFLSLFPLVKKHPFVEHAFLYKKEEYELGKDLLYEQGAISIQEPSSMMAPYFLQAEPNDVVLDLCAAPGGKSIEAALKMNDQGVLIANDISFPRAKNLSQNIERMGLGNVIVSSTDFAFAYSHFLGRFDKIILDAPCSGSAMFRKDEDSKKDWTPFKVKSCAKRQVELLNIAYQMLKDGGTLSYSTCSFSYQEDEGVILEFKKDHPEAVLASLPEDPSFYRSQVLPEAIHLFPHHFVGEGQFICLIKKPGVGKKEEAMIVRNKKYQGFIEQYGLANRSNEILRDKFFSLSQHFDVSHLNILRYGVKLFEVKDFVIPDNHLSHYLSSENSIPLSYEQVKAYIHGDTFPLEGEEGFHSVSYLKRNLGFVKISQGIAKNHYPKGLRRVL